MTTLNDQIVDQMIKMGARVEEEVVVEETATAKTTTQQATVDPAALREMAVNQALINFAHTGYNSLRRMCSELGKRLDEDALRMVFVNFLYAAVQDAVLEAAVAAPDVRALTLTRAGLDLRARFSGAVRSAMRDDKQPEIQAWLHGLTDEMLDRVREDAFKTKPAQG
jgi:hypothetical protein